LIIRGAICPQIVRNADHRRVLNLRQLVNDALHLGGGDVLATRDYQVVLSVGQIEEAFGVEVADIARAEPIAEERAIACGEATCSASRSTRAQDFPNTPAS
jgi:hypothetical protein